MYENVAEKPYAKPNVRVEEHSEEEVVSNTSSSDVTETEEHVTVHAKREPLPWSLRGTKYDKPLPNVGDSNLSAPMNRDEGQILPKPVPSPIQKSPIQNYGQPPSQSSLFGVGSKVDNDDSANYTTFQSLSDDVTALTSIPQPVGRRFRDFSSIPIPISFPDSLQSTTSESESGSSTRSPSLKSIGPKSPIDKADLTVSRLATSPSTSVASSIESFRPPQIDIRVISPMSAEHIRSPPPSPEKPASPQAAAIAAKSPSPLVLGTESTSRSPSGSPIRSPQPIPISFFETSKGSKASPIIHQDPSTSSVSSPDLEWGASLVNKESESPAISLDLLEAGLSPKAMKPESSEQFVQPQASSSRIVEKRGIPPLLAPTAAPSPVLKKVKVGPTTSDSFETFDRHSFIVYRQDWKVNRRYRSEQFFFPKLFNPVRLQYVSTPRHRKPVPREFLRVAEDADPGAKYRRDWQAIRRNYVYDYFDPGLFETDNIKRIKIPMKRSLRRRTFKSRMAALGISDLNSPAAKLRLDWATSRAFPVEQFFEPSLFDINKDAGKSLREDWYVMRKSPIYANFNPKLFDHGYHLRKQKTFHSMLARLNSGKSHSYPKHTERRYIESGQKYRDDWQVVRQNHVYEYFDPKLFDEEKAQEEAGNWNKVTTKPSEKEVDGASTKLSAEKQLSPDHVAIPVTPHSPTLIYDTFLQPSRKGLHMPAPGTAQELITKLKMDLGNHNSQDQYYDWPFWESLFEKERDEIPNDEIFLHICDTRYAPIPMELVPFIWKHLTDADNDDFFKNNYEGLENAPGSSFDAAITADVQRLTKKHELSKEQAQRLYRVVVAYLNYDPDLSYSSIIPTIAIPFITSNMSENDAFAGIVHIMFENNHREHHLNNYEELMFAFENLLNEIDPELTVHLEHHGVFPDLYAWNWYSDLFPSFSTKLRNHLMTSFMVKGHMAIHKMALALIIENRDELLQADTFTGIIAILMKDDLIAVHPDWNSKQWMETVGDVILRSDDLENLYLMYGFHQRELHEMDLLQTTTQIKQEHDLLLGYLSWLSHEVYGLCSDREGLYSSLCEWYYGCQGHIEKINHQTRQIHHLQTELHHSEKKHVDEVRKLTALLNAEPAVQSVREKTATL